MNDDQTERLLKELQEALEKAKKDFPDANLDANLSPPKPEFQPSYYLLDEKDVHTEHCCEKHKACKYMDLDCTVATGQKKASYPCNCDHF